jgi:integrase
MNIFLEQLSKQYAKEEILLVCDGAGWHKSKDLVVPENIHIHHIPPHTPEMNPIEQIWREIRTRGFKNEVFNTLEDIIDRLCHTIASISVETVKSITGRDWILSLLYKSCFIKHLLPTFGLMNMKAIDATQLQEFVNGFSGSSKSQITLVIGTLRAIFSTAYAEGYIDRDPSAALIRPKASRKEERRPLTPEETRNVLAVAENHPDGLIVAVLYYLGLRRGEALGLKWGDFDFEEDQVHIERDIDFAGPTAQEGELKTEAADRYVPIPPELKAMLLKVKGKPGEYVFHNDKGCPLSQATFKRKWCQLMLAADCADWREVPKGTNRSGDILKQIKPRLTPHFFRHNYVTLLYESGVDPLIAMKIVGHTDYQTTANIYTHVRDEMLKKATVNMNEVFQKRTEE